MSNRQAWNTFSTPVAAKDHYCVWCGKTPGIKIGEKHLKFVGKFEGDFQDWRIHTECDAARFYYPDEPICDRRHEKGQSCAKAGHT